MTIEITPDLFRRDKFVPKLSPSQRIAVYVLYHLKNVNYRRLAVAFKVHYRTIQEICRSGPNQRLYKDVIREVNRLGLEQAFFTHVTEEIAEAVNGASAADDKTRKIMKHPSPAHGRDTILIHLGKEFRWRWFDESIGPDNAMWQFDGPGWYWYNPGDVWYGPFKAEREIKEDIFSAYPLE